MVVRQYILQKLPRFDNTTASPLSIEYVCVAGGGSGRAKDNGGGGGAGGYLTGTTTCPTSPVTVTIGAGGVQALGNYNGTQGGPGGLSGAVTVSVTGGGAGAGPGSGGPGGSGGGGNFGGSGGSAALDKEMLVALVLVAVVQHMDLEVVAVPEVLDKTEQHLRVVMEVLAFNFHQHLEILLISWIPWTRTSKILRCWWWRRSF